MYQKKKNNKILFYSLILAIGNTDTLNLCMDFAWGNADLFSSERVEDSTPNFVGFCLDDLYMDTYDSDYKNRIC
ncbi:hypothetical protein ES319_A10G205000v1 [Gossypium barbadense]|uniref:Uncharacterized protein n=1 Tax=Gossypium barbadense TaxID=3634 RepID=A0A5J5U6B4_GOSBA|nr:hypothetical protein ES319_A10G205000v1 [Gossypium barbadense]